MAVIGKIRKHSTFLLIAVGGAIVLFVLSDLLGVRGQRKHNIPDIAIVDKEKITYRDFNDKFEQQLDLYKQQFGENINNQLLFQIKEEVLNEMIRNAIMTKQYEKVGVKVVEAELYDMLTGVNVHHIIKQNFVDPQTKQFNPALVTQYIQRLDEMEPKQRNQWYNIEKMIREERISKKYTNLISKGFFIPKAMAKYYNKNQNTYANAKIVSLKYSTIPDDSVKVTEEDYKAYYEEHKKEFEQENSRWLDYVIFDVQPSDEDHANAKKQVEQIYLEFSNIPPTKVRENYNFVKMYSDPIFKSDSNYVKRTMLPPQADTLFDRPIGTIVGPFFEQNAYFMVKLIDRQARPDSMKAAHILIAYKGALRADPEVKRTKEEAKKKADSLFNVVKKPDSLIFAKISTEFSDDKTAKQNGGDLGWFTDGQMVYEFNKACIEHNVGEVFVVESPFGFHVVWLKDKKNIETKVRVASIKYPVEPSSQTRQKVYTEASKFAGENTTPEAFDKAVTELGYNKRTAENVMNNEYSLPGIQDGREIIRWAFSEEAKEGTVSKVFDLIGENKNVVVLVKMVRNKGIAPLEQVKKQIESQVIKEKKKAILLEKVNKVVQKHKTIEEIAKALNVEVQTSEKISFGSINVPLIGPEPKLNGLIFALKPNQISKPIAGEAAIFVAQLISKEEPKDENTDLKDFISTLEMNFRSRSGYELYNALFKKADITDNRTLFY